MNQEERQFITETDARTQVALAEAMKDAIEANADTTEVARIYSSALANAPMDVDPVTYARKAVDDFIETYRPTITSGLLVPVNE
jgi:regulator of protease activity HflC (stomatin/prohibitin superfamily)